jgi:hypothetical protein
LSYWPLSGQDKPALDYKLLRLAMLGVLLATRAILAELHPVRIVTTILFGCVVPLFAIITLECNDRANIFLFGSHANLPTFSKFIP